jgi:hypothetical protein
LGQPTAFAETLNTQDCSRRRGDHRAVQWLNKLKRHALGDDGGIRL